MYYNTNGIPSTVPIQDKFYIIESIAGDYVFKEGDSTLEIERYCIELRSILATHLFGTIEEYRQYLLAPIYSIVSQAGIDAEIKVSKEEFENLITGDDIKEKELLNKLLYSFDVENLISTIQNSVLETKTLVGEFYKLLNTNSFFIKDGLPVVDNDFQYASGPIVTNITAIVNHLFINLYSQLDFTTKIIFELENLHNNFSSYPKLRSKDILFGDVKRTEFKDKPNTIYDLTDDIRMIMYLRNEIVHNASIDSLPKVYQRIENKNIVEKFILLPDFENGIIKSHKNRKRFFDNGTKLNEMLPSLIQEFWEKLKNTLSEIKLMKIAAKHVEADSAP